jgi:hypothetical protein
LALILLISLTVSSVAPLVFSPHLGGL